MVCIRENRKIHMNEGEERTNHVLQTGRGGTSG